MHAAPWIRTADPAAHLRLLCLPYAGGGTADYRSWSSRLPGTIEICPVLLPGRESRLGEPAHDTVPPLVASLADALVPLVRRTPYAIYGHSMGSWIGFELVRALRQRRCPLPVHLFVAARRAPHLPPRLPLLGALPRDAFIAAVQERYAAIPEPILDNDELMDLFLPTLRADFRLLDAYTHVPEAPLPIPITALHGNQDPHVVKEDVAAWETHTSAKFDLRVVSGGHFFLREAIDDVTDLVGGILNRALR